MSLASEVAAHLPVSLEMRARLWNEGADARLAKTLTDPARLFVDVGANAGLYAWIARRQGAEAIAVEPHPVMASRLRMRLPDVEVVEAALSDTVGTATLYVPSVGHHDVTTRSSLAGAVNEGFEQRTVTVQVRRLDDLLEERGAVGFVKIDVEGHEDGVLRGARRILESDRPVILIEIEWRHHRGRAPELIASLTADGYEGGFLLDGRYRPLAEFDPVAMQASDNLKAPGVRLGKRPVYVNNFLFVHATDERAHRLLKRSRWSR